MFEKSIVIGLSILEDWKIWIVIVTYLAINFGFLMLMAKIARDDDVDGEMGKGCLLHIVGGTMLQGMLMGLMLIILFPILLGQSTSMMPFFKTILFLWPMIKISAIATAVVTILTYIPLSGKFLVNSPGIQAFLEGAIIFRLLSSATIDKIMTGADVKGSVVPGFWISMGFLLIAIISVRLIMFLLSMLAKAFKNTVLEELMPILIIPVFGVLGGIIPLFFYTSYFRLSLMLLVKN